MNEDNFLDKNIKDMTLDEKKEFVRNMIRDQSPSTQSAFYDPQSGRTINVKEFAKTVGEETAVEILAEMLDKSDISKPIRVTADEADALFDKFNKGQCTPEELETVEMLMQASSATNGVEFTHQLLVLLIDFLSNAQTEIKYDASIKDMFGAFDLLIMTNFAITGRSQSSRYLSNLSELMSITEEIGTDILNTWENSCENVPDDDMIILALLAAVRIKLIENNYIFNNAESIRDTLQIETLDELCDKQETLCEECREEKIRAAKEDPKFNDMAKEIKDMVEKGRSMRNILKED